ncbi:MAG: TonB-dependent receptor [Bacteroidota bacterium]
MSSLRVITFVIFFLSGFVLFGQNTLSGTITDHNGEPLPGANIILNDGDWVTISDEDGFFRFGRLNNGAYQLEVSYIGYQTTKQAIMVNGNTDFETALKPINYNMAPVEVLSTWADKETPMTYTNLDKETIEQNNLGQDVPFLLRWTPSVVVTSDAGTGIGYTGIRIRGSDPTRINVTINGIPLNDAESQGTFWVDLPDFASSTDQIQIQRGVGTSTNGAGAFGGTINLNTAKVHQKPYVQLSNSVGSFNTVKNNIQLGTGLLANRFTIDGRLSRINSDGYIDRATARLRSFFVSAAYLGDRQSLRLNVFAGNEVTYQAWNGVPAQYVDIDSLRTFNTAGTERPGEPHDNEVDDYTQTHYQLLYNRELGTDWQANVALHYTKGKGFFEQYKANELLTDYRLDRTETSDVIRRRWLDNDFYGFTYSLNYRPEDQPFDVVVGGAWHEYLGGHFGEAVWSELTGELQDVPNYYDNDAEKRDFNIYAKANYRLNRLLNAYVDLQYRRVNYEFLGQDQDGQALEQDDQLNFFNPKLGLYASLTENSAAYISFGVGNREPNRNDYVDSSPQSRPKHETLYNTELGYRQQWTRGSFGANIYHMAYNNQLALTGQLNDVGASTRVNIDDSYRLGLEIQGDIRLLDQLQLAGALSLSQNKISRFDEYIDNWDTGMQEVVMHENTDLAFSPNVIGHAELNYDVFKNDGPHTLRFSLAGKYVGDQFIDNTSNEAAQLDAYFFSDFRLYYSFKNRIFKELGVTLLVRNLFDARFSTNAWTYRYISEGYDARPDDPYARLEGGNVYNLTGFFPQAGRNFLLGLDLRF